MGSHTSESEAIEKIGAFEAKAHLSRLLREAASGKRFIITQRGKEVAQLGPPQRPEKQKKWGDMEGKIRMSEDFWAPIPELEEHFG